MIWSKLRAQIEARFAPALRGRVTLRQARYRYTQEEVGRVWLALDGRELASFPTGARWQHVRAVADRLMDAREAWGSTAAYHDAMADAEAAARGAGVYGDQEALDELEASLSLPIDAALTSVSPLQRAVAVLDARVGKRRLRALLAAADAEHPPVATLLRARCDAEGVRPPAPVA